MDKNDVLSMLDTECRPTKARNKRKWREIEAIKDEYRLRKELEEMGFSLENEWKSIQY